MSEDLLPYFLEEGREQAERARHALGDVARGVEPAAALEVAFRAFHTLKGSAALFDMAELGGLLHAAESLLETARRSGGALPQREVSWFGECVDEIERWLDVLQSEGAPSPPRRRAAATLEARLHGREEAPVTAPDQGWAREAARAADVAAACAVRYAPDAETYFRGEDPLAAIRSVPDLLWLHLDRRPSDSNTPFACDLTLTALSGAAPASVAAALKRFSDQVEVVALEAPAADARSGPPAGRTVRVEAAALDAASELLDQLLIAKNSLAHEIAAELGARAESARGVGAAQLALERATAALHGALGQLRLAPLRRLFAPLPRQVSEMAQALGKQAELAISGEEVAVDKAIMDGLYEPLIHLLRNAVDHGVEAPSARAAAGKPARSVIRLDASPRGDAVVIEVSDDGGGLDLGRIRAVAAERGLLSLEAAEALSDAEAADLIFRPGFSTARVVTDLSGRGVGLDAVRAALARLGGRVEAENHPGQGVVMRMTAPLRVMLTRVAVLAAGGERFGTPLDAIREVVRVPKAAMTRVRATDAAVVRGEVLPILSLGALVGGKIGAADPLTVAVVDAADGRVGVAVDRIEGVLQAPVQTAPPLLAGLPGVTGSLLQGDGSVLLLLDLAALAS